MYAPGQEEASVSERPEAHVAWLFSRWNQLISGTVDAMVYLVKPENGELKFINKVSRYIDIFNLEISDPNLKMFTQGFLVDKCSTYYILKKEINEPGIDDVRLADAKAKLKQIGKASRVNLKQDYPKVYKLA